MSGPWPMVRLSEVTRKVGSGATPKGGEASYHRDGTPFIRSMNVIFFGFRREGLAYLNEQQAEALSGATVLAGDVLLNITGASIGRVTLAPPDLAGARVNQHVAIIRPIEGLNAKFLSAYLSSPVAQGEIFSENYGVTRQALTKAQILDFQVPFPPLGEQERLAAKLDTMMSQLEVCRERLDLVPGILRRFRQSILNAATSGRLTEDWRESRSAKLQWREVELNDVAEDFSYGTSAKSSAVGLVPVLRMGNIQGGRLDWANLVFSNDPTEIAKYRLTSGDVLFNRTNSPELVGKTAIYKGEREAIYAGYLIRIRCQRQFLIPDYLNYCLNSPAGRHFCWQVKTDGVSQSNINASKLAAFRFQLPTLEEQEEIIRRVGRLFSFVDVLEIQLREARSFVERVAPTLLAKAFRGELVPQDPTDESAFEPMARLRARLSAAAAEPRRRRPKVIGEKPIMTTTKEAIKAAILKLKVDSFSFDDLWAQVAGDYETVKDALFELLEEPRPILRQCFDKKSKTLQLVRVKP